MADFGILVMFLLVAVVASVGVRAVALVLSDRVRQSVIRHPIVHILWLLAGIAALTFLVFTLWTIASAIK